VLWPRAEASECEWGLAQALLRGKREREKALKRHQRSDRAAFLKALGELERDALEQTLPDLMQWAEAGAG